ncbi:hypothetical protein [Streptomyces sp. TS71-3]|uniref:hypothetical protein n=1 Tax=Streptomyces sp. TS71-3 TaxID=2733862 RepID=UPI001B2CF981|nr:hypothetical protein [Streptomyces sp. TS71-3]GHJ37726.1 hypothetical protein Sm713_33350 [Streptomyces sp. TS71-3]
MSASLLDEVPGAGAQPDPARSGEEPADATGAAPAPALLVLGAEDAPACSDGACLL